MRGADAVIKALEVEGIKHIFGVPGGYIIDIYDALYDSNIKHILTRHEQAAVHAADGYARASGKTGTAFTTSGPGATNTVTGIVTAYKDSSPVVIITGQVPRLLIGNDAFQEADITGITMPITKHNFLITNEKELLETIKKAYYVASTGRPGPVLVDIPKDIAIADVEFDYPEKVEIKGYKPRYSGHPKQIKRAVELIMKAERPIILAGGGVRWSNASFELMKLAESIPAYVVTSLMGRGVIPEDHPLCLGFVGICGRKYANYALKESDLIIAIGTSFSDKSIESDIDSKKIIHIDIDPAEIGKNVKADVPIVGDAKLILKEIVKLIKYKKRKEWEDKIEGLKKLSEKEEIDKVGEIIKRIFEFYSDAIITLEPTKELIEGSKLFKFKNSRQFITSGGLGTVGFSLPAAVGAQVASQDKLVVSITNSKGMLMNIQELATSVDFNIPVKIIVMNMNGERIEHPRLDKLSKIDVSNKNINKKIIRKISKKELNFEKIARGFGAVSIAIENPNEVNDALKEVSEIKDRPSLIEIRL